jgi:type IV fimbrial biogenesis protein FimT
MAGRYAGGRRRVRGVTLIEQVMVVAILAVLAGVACPSLAGLLHRQRLQVAQSDFIAALNYARGEAVTRQARLVFCPTRDHSRCSEETRWEGGWLVGLDRDHDNQPDSAPLRTGENYAQLIIQSSEGRRHVTFLPDGTAGGSNLTLLFCSVSQTQAPLRVVVSNSGRVRGAKPDTRQAGCADS